MPAVPRWLRPVAATIWLDSFTRTRCPLLRTLRPIRRCPLRGPVTRRRATAPVATRLRPNRSRRCRPRRRLSTMIASAGWPLCCRCRAPIDRCLMSIGKRRLRGDTRCRSSTLHEHSSFVVTRFSGSCSSAAGMRPLQTLWRLLMDSAPNTPSVPLPSVRLSAVPSGKLYVRAVTPGLRKLLYVVFGLLALLGANSLYLVAITALEAATKQTYQNYFYQFMFLGHLVLGLIFIVPFVVFGA